MLSCHDNFEANFDNYPSMLSYHQALSMASSWRRCKVKDLHVEPLDSASPLYGHPAAFAAGTSEDAIEDTAANLGLALNVDGNIYPVRGTAYKTLTERAKVGGTALPKLSRKDLANVLNACLPVHNSDALLLIRNEKVSAVHSGDETDYSVLPMDELLVTLEKKLGERFPGFVFESGYTDHAYNLVIYGHHMNDGYMFADLCKYADADFCKEHPTITFDTLSSLGNYEIVAAFKFNTNRETFKYNEYTLMDEPQFAEFMENVHARQLYDTGVTAEYGDQLLTLSTCEYTYANGRFVVVAKKV